jgi:hypothetical protein
MRGPVKRKLFYKGRDREKEILRILQQTFFFKSSEKGKVHQGIKIKIVLPPHKLVKENR